MKTWIFQTVFIVLASSYFSKSLSAQEKTEKLNETFQVKDNVVIDVDGKYTSFIVETWNKDEVEVEAFIKGEGFSEEKRKSLMANWELKVVGNSENIQISSLGNRMGFPSLPTLRPGFDHENIAFVGPMMKQMIAPMMQEISVMKPVLPPSFYSNLGSLSFDYDAYEKKGEDYLKEYEEQIREKFGKSFEVKMEKWSEQTEKAMEARRKVLEERRKMLEGRREKLEVQFAEKAQQRNEQMQARYDLLSKRMEEFAKNNPNAEYSKTVTVLPNGGREIHVGFQNSGKWDMDDKHERTIIIRMPKNTVLNLHVRHGKVELENAVANLSARLSHTPLTASEIYGKETKVQVSYAPVEISNWKYGVLNLSYVPDCSIEVATSLKLASNSSDVTIGKLDRTGILIGSFGELSIFQVGKDFQTLQIDLKNSDLNLNIPEIAFDFSYNGSHSNIDVPSSLQLQTRNDYGMNFMEGYYKSKDNSGKISIKASFSEVVLKE